jgi:hypothetical protein
MPRYVGKDVRCSTRVTSLHDIHHHTSFIGGALYVPNLKRDALGLLLVDGLKRVFAGGDEKWAAIINRHLADKKDLLACQEELIDNDLDEYARL